MVSKPGCQLTVRMRKMDVAMVSDVYWYGDGVPMAVVVRKTSGGGCPGNVTVVKRHPTTYIAIALSHHQLHHGHHRYTKSPPTPSSTQTLSFSAPPPPPLLPPPPIATSHHR
ncbi:hypothetical protein QVD17_15191 [Tagetes erecta]|uniref:Uncharacterized protein n=1 Tax=Tagetes erecta TaxID=13708 RepID=A0AAD8KP82_TARER|nr:hypothetical protein QVD17_15191 [Tagetes erecta]